MLLWWYKKTYGEIPNGQFTFERKRRRINCLTKKVTLCFSTPYVCLDKFWLNNLWLLLFGSPKHYFLLVCFSVSFSNLAVHDTLTQQFVVIITSLHCIALVLHTHTFYYSFLKSQNISASTGLKLIFWCLYCKSNNFVESQLEKLSKGCVCGF